MTAGSTRLLSLDRRARLIVHQLVSWIPTRHALPRSRLIWFVRVRKLGASARLRTHEMDNGHLRLILPPPKRWKHSSAQIATRAYPKSVAKDQFPCHEFGSTRNEELTDDLVNRAESTCISG